jgi:hypothetical protein
VLSFSSCSAEGDHHTSCQINGKLILSGIFQERFQIVVIKVTTILRRQEVRTQSPARNYA